MFTQSDTFEYWITFLVFVNFLVIVYDQADIAKKE